MERVSRTSSSGNRSGGGNRNSHNTHSSSSHATKSRSPPRRRRRLRAVKTRHSRNWKCVTMCLVLTPLIITLALVLHFLKRIETPEPLLSPQQVHEVQHAQELHHLHLLEEIQREQQQQKQKQHHHDVPKKHEKHQKRQREKEQPHNHNAELSKQQHLRGNAEPNSTSHHHAHIIPNILIFTHSIDLINATQFENDEDMVLKKNVEHTIKLHPDALVRFLTDEDCVSSIQTVMGHDSPLVQFFKEETEGMYKADICRGAALYETGGLYFDVDLHARMSMWDVLRPSTEFVVPQVHVASKHRGSYFQAFIGATSKHPILYRYLDLFIQHYQGKLHLEGKPLGVVLLKMAHDDVVKDQNAIELWQEVLYKRDFFPNVPPPNYGTRRACHFVVVANKKPPFVVPFYSRVKGSRMCGGKDSKKVN